MDGAGAQGVLSQWEAQVLQVHVQMQEVLDGHVYFRNIFTQGPT